MSPWKDDDPSTIAITGVQLGGNKGMEKNMETNYYNGLDGDFYKDPFLDCELTEYPKP